MTTDKILETLNWIKVFEADGDEEKEAMDAAMDAVRKTMGISGADLQLNNGTKIERKWIPCSEDMPEILPEKFYIDGEEFFMQSECCALLAEVDNRRGEKKRIRGIGRLCTDDGQTTYWIGTDEDGVWNLGDPRLATILAWEPLLGERLGEEEGGNAK